VSSRTKDNLIMAMLAVVVLGVAWLALHPLWAAALPEWGPAALTAT
jgi:hypothetical protein